MTSLPPLYRAFGLALRKLVREEEPRHSITVLDVKYFGSDQLKKNSFDVTSPLQQTVHNKNYFLKTSIFSRQLRTLVDSDSLR